LPRKHDVRENGFRVEGVTGPRPRAAGRGLGAWGGPFLVHRGGNASGPVAGIFDEKAIGTIAG